MGLVRGSSRRAIGCGLDRVAKLDGNAVRTQRTRGRILAESLKLFNEHGEAQVTTGMVAEALGMSPGNLYYHFRNKDEIVEQLFTRFEERIDVQPKSAYQVMSLIAPYLVGEARVHLDRRSRNYID